MENILRRISAVLKGKAEVHARYPTINTFLGVVPLLRIDVDHVLPCQGQTARHRQRVGLKAGMGNEEMRNEEMEK